MRDLQKYSTHAYRMEYYNELAGDRMLCVFHFFRTFLLQSSKTYQRGTMDRNIKNY
jgi:hypothetical protein